MNHNSTPILKAARQLLYAAGCIFIGASIGITIGAACSRSKLGRATTAADHIARHCKCKNKAKD